MQQSLPVLVMVVVAAIAAAAIIAGWLYARKRRKALAALAAELGFMFDPGEDHGHDEQYAPFAAFQRGGRRRAYNTLEGAVVIDGREFSCRMGDFRYTVQHGKSASTHRFSFLIVHPPFRALPDLLIRRENVFDKITGVFGFDDIDFESAEFSRRFHVQSRDRRFAYAVIHPGMIDFLMADDPGAIDLRGGACCLTDGSRCWAPEEFRAKLAWITRFFDLWPDHVTKELEARARC